MIITQQKSEIFGSQVQMNSFNIKSSPKAFQILSSNLYSNKIRAIIREYSCNALDAHRYAKCEDKPFKVQLPTVLEPTFIVRDFGNGLSPEEITELFTTYFSSSKDQSNDFTGALGLGSKSAFSYTDSFSCKSYHNGTMYVYSLFLDQGEPKVTLMYQSETDEPSGVEIIIPVKQDDCDLFIKEANFVYGAFDVIPDGFTTKSKKVNKIPGLSVLKTRFYFGDFVFYARMGNVFYPIDSSYISGIYEIKSDLYWLHLANYDNICYVDFDIGELDISPSREQLSYDNRTIENIKKKLDALNIKNFCSEYFKSNNDSYDKSSWAKFGQSIIKKINEDFNLTKDYRFDCESRITEYLKEQPDISGQGYMDYLQVINDYFAHDTLAPDNLDKMDLQFQRDNFTCSYIIKTLSRTKHEEFLRWKAKSNINNLLSNKSKDDWVFVFNLDSSWYNIKTYLPTYIEKTYPNRPYVIFKGDEVFFEEFKKYSEEQWKRGDIKILKLSDILQDIKSHKKKNTVKVQTQKTKIPLDYIITNRANYESGVGSSKDTREEFYSVAQFRKYLDENPDIRFIPLSSGYSHIYYNVRFSNLSLISLFPREYIEFKNKFGLDKICFTRSGFRWADEIEKRGLWFDAQNILSVFDFSTLKPEEICEVLLSLGLYIDEYESFEPKSCFVQIGNRIRLSDNQFKFRTELLKMYHLIHSLKNQGFDSKEQFDDYISQRDNFGISTAANTLYNFYKFRKYFYENNMSSKMKSLINRILNQITELTVVEKTFGDYRPNMDIYDKFLNSDFFKNEVIINYHFDSIA